MRKRTYYVLNVIWASSAMTVGVLINMTEFSIRETMLVLLTFVAGVMSVYIPTHENSNHRLGEPYNE